jgi:hypothetical protein
MGWVLGEIEKKIVFQFINTFLLLHESLAFTDIPEHFVRRLRQVVHAQDKLIAEGLNLFILQIVGLVIIMVFRQIFGGRGCFLEESESV